jgi:hypothetical protein
LQLLIRSSNDGFVIVHRTNAIQPLQKDIPILTSARNPRNVSGEKARGTPAERLALFRWLFAALSVLSIVPCWTVRYPVLADYPQYLARCFVLFHARDSAHHFRGCYAPDWAPFPYVLTVRNRGSGDHGLESSGHAL